MQWRVLLLLRMLRPLRRRWAQSLPHRSAQRLGIETHCELGPCNEEKGLFMCSNFLKKNSKILLLYILLYTSLKISYFSFHFILIILVYFPFLVCYWCSRCLCLNFELVLLLVISLPILWWRPTGGDTAAHTPALQSRQHWLNLAMSHWE